MVAKAGWGPMGGRIGGLGFTGFAGKTGVNPIAACKEIVYAEIKDMTKVAANVA